ncbi:MAG: hypothetical protein KatS3mg051_0244 [Anaerolineae bacterium]|nr:MAG: hypothetical protein KatS3mg051_0244 [Anaerolineae bacterium]
MALRIQIAWPGQTVREAEHISAQRAAAVHIEQSPVAWPWRRGGPGTLAVPEYVNVTDLGLLVYQDDQSTSAWCGKDPVPDRRAAICAPSPNCGSLTGRAGTVRFEIRDRQGQPALCGRGALRPGTRLQHPMLPGTWLPLRGRGGGFRRRGSIACWLAGGMTLAVHRFVWRPAGSALRPYLASDGEISPKPCRLPLRAQAVHNR